MPTQPATDPLPTALPSSTLGGRIRALRRAKGWTQEQLARACGVSRSAVAQWESDRAQQIAHNMGAIADALGVKPDTLRHGMDLISDPRLTGEEQHLLTLFRRCGKRQREAVIRVADAFVTAD